MLKLAIRAIKQDIYDILSLIDFAFAWAGILFSKINHDMAKSVPDFDFYGQYHNHNFIQNTVLALIIQTFCIYSLFNNQIGATGAQSIAEGCKLCPNLQTIE